jgi:hypothetical protein
MPRESAPGARWRNTAALALLVLGSLQMIGAATGNRVLRGVGAASAMSPLPRVFSDVDGLETFASEFTVRYRDARGDAHELAITPDNRRNVYGAALSYAPMLPEGLWTSVYCYGFAPDGPLRRELGLSPDDTHLTFTIRTRTRGRSDQWTYAPRC